LGGLKSSTRRLLARVAEESNTRPPAEEPPTRVRPGTVLISMGRLTLNVLLSFAQFEREVTGERIRDKIDARAG